MSNLIDMKGCKYLDDRKVSEHQQRYIMTFKYTTVKEVFAKRPPIPPNYLQLLGRLKATHVVTAITYGGQAFIICDQETKNETQKQQLDIKTLVTKVKAVLDGTSTNTNPVLTEEEINYLTKFKVKCQADFKLPSVPNTFKEAVELFHSLPTILQSVDKKCIPVQVWMEQLTHFNGNPENNKVREVKISLVDDVEYILETFRTFSMECMELLETKACEELPALSKNVAFLQITISRCKKRFQEELKNILPEIRAEAKDEIELRNLIAKMKSSPFGYRDLEHYIEINKAFVESLQKYITEKHIEFVQPYNIPLHQHYDTYCLTFKLFGEDPYLEAIQLWCDKGFEGNAHNISNKVQRHSYKKFIKTVNKNIVIFIDLYK